MDFLTRHLIERLVAWRVPLLAMAAVVALAAFPYAQALRFDRSIENLFAPGDPLLEPYRKLKRTFGGNEVVLAVYVDDHLFAADGRGMRRLADTRRRIGEVPGVKAAVSLDEFLGPERMVVPDDPFAGRIRDLFEGYMHGRDGRTVAVVTILEPADRLNVPREETIGAMQQIVEGLPHGLLAGEPVLVVEGLRYLERDSRRLAWTSTLLLGATILILFRSIRWLIIPVAIVQWTLVVTKAAMVCWGWELSMISSMLSAIITVVAVATVVHVLVHFRDACRRGLVPCEAMAYCGTRLASPVFWSCATTAVGFGSLAVARIEPMRDFGLMMAVGVMVVLGGMALVMPGLALIGRVDTEPARAWGEGRLEAGLDRLVRSVRERPKTVSLAMLAASALAMVGMTRLEVETDYTRNFRGDSPIVRSYEYTESHLGGAGIWDVILPAPGILDWEYLRKIERLEDRLRDEVLVHGPDSRPVHGLTKVLSLMDAVAATSASGLKGIGSSRQREMRIRTSLYLVRRQMPALAEALYGEDPLHQGRHCFRIMLRSRERQPARQKREIIRQVRAIAASEFPPRQGASGAEVTGLFVLLANVVDSILRDQWLTFGVATAGIALAMLAAMRSFRLALAALVPNTLPILVVTGLMGWAGLKINMGAAMIAAVSVGLSVDSSLHYINVFRRARREGKTLDECLAAAHQSAGRAMTFATLALVVGLTALAASEFVPTIYFGLLTSLTMLGGLAGNLVVLPVLLKLLYRV